MALALWPAESTGPKMRPFSCQYRQRQRSIHGVSFFSPRRLFIGLKLPGEVQEQLVRHSGEWTWRASFDMKRPTERAISCVVGRAARRIGARKSNNINGFV